MAVTTTSPARSTRKPATKSKTKSKQRSNGAAMIDPERRRALIALAAYVRAERRGFAPGHEEADWLAAEAEIDMALSYGADEAVQ
jgi:hypothetical protein